MPLQLQRQAITAAKPQAMSYVSRARPLVVRASKQETMKSTGHVALAATLTASMMLGGLAIEPEAAFAATTGGRASASKFRSSRRASSAAVS
jgi:hypothetical protein